MNNQLVIRTEKETQTHLSQVAQWEDTSISSIVRELLEEHLPRRMQAARAAYERKERDRGAGVTEASVDEEMKSLLDDFKNGRSIRIRPRAMASSRGKAAYRILHYLWSEETIDNEDAEHLRRIIAGIRETEPVDPTPAPPRVRQYRAKGSGVGEE